MRVGERLTSQPEAELRELRVELRIERGKLLRGEELAQEESFLLGPAGKAAAAQPANAAQRAVAGPANAQNVEWLGHVDTPATPVGCPATPWAPPMAIMVKSPAAGCVVTTSTAKRL